MDSSQLISLLRKYKSLFHPVVSFNPVKDKLVSFDFTAGNKELKSDILNNIAEFIVYINDKLDKAGARYGIGGYGEHRTFYSMSKVFDAEKPGEEPRRLHLGTDIWGKPNTAVMAPCDSIIHSFAFNNRFGDYGTTILLTHNLDGFTFYTLYGHLSLNSIKNLQGGESLKRGDVFAEFGIPVENGNWPPHLHFQLITDLENHQGDYPGVCKFSEKEKWLTNCPDPDLILQLNQYLS